MHHIASKNIKDKTRHPYLERYRQKLKEALRQPGLTAEQRQHIQAQLGQLKKGKDYTNVTAPPGALPNNG